MTIKWIILIPLLLLFLNCSGGKGSIKKPPADELKIIIRQDGINMDIVKNEAAIYKKPFIIDLIFSGKDSIFINASFHEDSYIQARDGKAATEIPGFSGTVISEELFNRDESLTISDSMQNFWHYKSESDHSFNEIKKENGRIICSRRISFINIIDDAKKKIQISDIIEETLYMVLMKLEWNKDYSRKIEKNRYYIKITLINTGPEDTLRKFERKETVK